MRMADLELEAFAKRFHGKRRSSVERTCGRLKLKGICENHICRDNRNSFYLCGLARRVEESLSALGSILFPFS